MGRKKINTQEQPKRKRRPALDPEARLSQLISLAFDQAEEQLLNGTASSQTINYFLKLGSSRDKKELELLEAQTELANAKVDAINSAKKDSLMYEKAIQAMRRYSGASDDDDFEFEY